MIGGVMLAAAVAVPAVTVIVAPTSATAQDFSTGSLAGTVTDSNGAPVAGASVAVRSNEQGFTRNVTTDASGSFRAALVPIGSYTVTIEAPGYDPVAQTASVALGGTSSYDFVLAAAGSGGAVSVDDVVVTGARQSLAFNETTTGLVVDLEELVKTVPIGRDITSVTLLAPSTVQGDSAFGNVPSVAGSSVAENAFYVNGLNITNFDNYIGGSTVPFDFYRSVEVKTGGYPAEFGRATGGIINAVTKSGSNDFEMAIRGSFAPDALREQSPDTYAARNELDEANSSSITVEAGGPIIEDRLFFFALAQFQENDTFNAGGANATYQESDDPFFGLKLDGYINDDHRLELTVFDTTRETRSFTSSFNPVTDEIGPRPDVPTVFELGGLSYVARYTGQFTDWLTLSAAYGKNEDRNNTIPASFSDNLAQDVRGTAAAINTQTTARRVSPNQVTNRITFPRETSREFYRADADIFVSLFGDHHIRAGYELEKTELNRTTMAPGQYGADYVYRRAGLTTPQAQGPDTILDAGEDYVELRIFQSGGSFTGENEAFYIQDSWDVSEQLTLNLGVRLDKFALNNAEGTEYVSFDNEVGPRLGFTFDPLNDGRSRVFGSYGRYYLPVASNTAFRQGAAELFYSEYFMLEGYAAVAPGTFNGQGQENVDANAVLNAIPYDANGLPIQLGDQIVNWTGASACPVWDSPAPDGSLGCRVTSIGEVLPTDALVAQNLESTAEDEWIIGYERKIGDLWSFTAALMYRDLLRNAEDVAIDLAVRDYCEANGYAMTLPGAAMGCGEIWNGFHQYVIVNPGAASTIVLSDPLPGETEVRTLDFSAAQLGYPKAKRTYTALELSFERAFDGIWALQGSWTISESRGNTEGYVKSDNGQTDAGITQDFDVVDLTEGADGLLPNHRGHVFKLFGSYQLTDNLLVGGNVSVSSPRAFGCIGLHPDPNSDAQDYGAASNYCGGKLVPRGTAAESEWIKQIDMSLRYTVPENFVPGDLVLRADIFNIFNFAGVTDIDEFGEDDGGNPRSEYLSPLGYQTPRYVRLGFDLTF
jgi:hypothetical protein